MSKIKKVFIDSVDDTELEIFCTAKGEICININDHLINRCIFLDISTAIAVSKEIRKEINVAKEL